MASHLGTMVLFAAIVALVFALLLREDWPEQLRIGGRIFGGLTIGATIVGWLMYLITP